MASDDVLENAEKTEQEEPKKVRIVRKPRAVKVRVREAGSEDEAEEKPHRGRKPRVKKTQESAAQSGDQQTEEAGTACTSI